MLIKINDDSSFWFNNVIYFIFVIENNCFILLVLNVIDMLVLSWVRDCWDCCVVILGGYMSFFLVCDLFGFVFSFL